MANRDTILCINNRSQFLGELTDYFASINIAFVDHSYDEPVPKELLDKVCGIAISGGPGIPHNPLDPTLVYELITWATNRPDPIPVIGFCLGAEIITYHYGGTVAKHTEAQHGDATVELTEEGRSRRNSLLPDEDDSVLLLESHSYFIDKVPEEFVVLAFSENCPVEIMKHRHLPLYCFQGHPEKSGYEGKPILDNFLELCGLKVSKSEKALVGLGIEDNTDVTTYQDEFGAIG
jgi:GMP synthase (glutamine-hydrolysing)